MDAGEVGRKGETAPRVSYLQVVEGDGSLQAQYDTRDRYASRENLIATGSPEVDFDSPEFDVASLPIDVEQEAIYGVLTQGPIGNKTWVDVGTGPGSFLHRLRVEFEHTGPSFGVEPNRLRQDVSGTTMTPQELLRGILGLPVDGKTASLIGRFTLDSWEKIKDFDASLQIEVPDFEIIEGSATNIPLPAGVANYVSANRMLYSLDPGEIKSAFDEFKRIGSDDALFLFITTGWRHRHQERDFLAQATQHFNAKPWKPLNHRFTTQKADEVIPEEFDYVYRCIHKDPIVYKGWLAIHSVVNSLRSVRDQIDPIPSRQDFDSFISKFVLPAIYYQSLKGEPYTDETEYSAYIASHHEMHGLPPEFKRVLPAEQKH